MAVSRLTPSNDNLTEESVRLVDQTDGDVEQQSLVSGTPSENNFELVRLRDPSHALHKTFDDSVTQISGVSGRHTPDQHSQTPRPITRSSRGRRKFELWSFEVLSCVIGLLSLMGIFWTLAVHNGQPVPQWPKLISINSLIAIFTAIMKAALLMPVAEGLCQLKWRHFSTRPRRVIDLNTFDAASRGPWGSFLLMFKAPKELLPILGALITVAALAIDPFSQQVVKYYTCPQPVQGLVATIARTNNYSQAGLTFTAGAYRTMDFNMTAAIYQALYHPAANASSLVPFTCRTGNCTFPADNSATHSSLGICHSYEDLSDEVITHVYGGGIETNYSLPSGAAIGQINLPVQAGPQQIRLSISALDLSISPDQPDMSSLVTFDTLMYSSAGLDGNISNAPMKPFAFRSSLYPCVRTYSSNITNFILNETAIKTTMLSHSYSLDSGSSLGDFVLATNTTLRNGVWHDCKPTSTKTSQNVVAFPSGTGNSTNESTQYYPADCVWVFTGDAIESFSMGMFWLLNGQEISNFDGPEPGEGYSAFLVNLGNHGKADAASVDQWLTQLTDAMTAVVRWTGDTTPADYVTGFVLATQTCIKIRWWWLSLPCSLLLLAALFTCLVIVIQSKTLPEQPVWKSSDLVLLYHGFRDSTISKHDVFESAKDMEKLSKATKARLILDEEDKRWRFAPFEKT